jgi:hypothetical protein
VRHIDNAELDRTAVKLRQLAIKPVSSARASKRPQAWFTWLNQLSNASLRTADAVIMSAKPHYFVISGRFVERLGKRVSSSCHRLPQW